MLLYPNCKINIGLRVIRKRQDGYHDLETVFYPVYGLHDELEVTRDLKILISHSSNDYLQANLQRFENSKIDFVQEGIAVDCPEEDNLIIRCYRMMQARFPQIGPVSIRFKKNIPFGAGLGGGSSDAAHMAIALNELFGLGLSQAELAETVRPLGADCPFFIYNTPCFAEGIGDRLQPIDFDLSGLRLVLAKPACAVSTREAYAGIRLHPEAAGKIGEALRSRRTAREMLQTSQLLVNDFEQTVFPLHPVIAETKEHLLGAGALYAAMSGSGSTVFGLFENDGKRGAMSGTAVTEYETASMIIFDDTLGERKA